MEVEKVSRNFASKLPTETAINRIILTFEKRFRDCREALDRLIKTIGWENKRLIADTLEGINERLGNDIPAETVDRVPTNTGRLIF